MFARIVCEKALLCMDVNIEQGYDVNLTLLSFADTLRSFFAETFWSFVSQLYLKLTINGVF